METKELLSQARDCAKNCDPKGLSVSGPNFKVTEYFRAPHLLGEVADRLEVVLSRMSEAEQQRDELLAALEALLQDYELLNKTQARCSDIFGNLVSAEGSGAKQARAAIAKAKGGAAINKTTGETK